jgi:ribose 5-phosphate isomerase A
MSAADPGVGVRAAATLAADLVENGATVGLGTGRAASAFIARLGERVRAGLSVACVATSEASARLARDAGLPLVELGEELELEVTVDGADEVAPNLDLVKGRGGALVRERIVAAASRRQVIVVGPEKLVAALGETGPIPVEIIPLALGLCTRRLIARGLRPAVRAGVAGGGPFVSDNGNLILDVALPAPLADAGAARALAADLRAIPGVVDTGLFLGTAAHVLIGHPDGRVDTRTSPESGWPSPQPSPASGRGGKS